MAALLEDSRVCGRGSDGNLRGALRGGCYRLAAEPAPFPAGNRAARRGSALLRDPIEHRIHESGVQTQWLADADREVGVAARDFPDHARDVFA